MGYISEDYCSEELSGMLIEKGYIGVTNTYLGKDDINVKQITLQSAMKWLREVHGLSIELFVDYGSDDESWWSVDVGKIKKDGLIDTLTGYSSYEQACEAAIKYCLENLI